MYSALLTVMMFTATANAADENARFAQVAAKYLREFPTFSPVGASSMGDHRFDGEMDDVSVATRKKKIAYLRGLETRLLTFAPEKLSLQNRIDHAMLLSRTRGGLFSLCELQEWAWNPTLYTGTCGNGVYHLVTRDYAPLNERLENVAQRLEQFPRFLTQTRESLDCRRVPPPHAKTAVKQNRGVLALLDEMVKPHIPRLKPRLRDRLEKAILTATAAIEEHQTWLENVLLPQAEGDFRIGEALFDKKLAFTLGTAMPREEIRQRAVSDLHHTRLEMYEVAKTIYHEAHPWTEFPENPTEAYRQAIIRAALEIACREIPPRDEIVQRATQALAEVAEFVRAKNLLTLPDDPVQVITMPEFRRGVAIAYCDAPGPMDIGQETYYAISPVPPDWTPEQVQSFLREYNRYSLYNLGIHEAMPGHFVQLALGSRYPGRLRAMLSSPTFIEGWAVYTEGMMIEQGFLADNPRMKLVQLKWHLRVVTNALIDQGIHVDGMTREDAMRLMVEIGFQEDREAALKWTRAQLSSTQLSTYFVGVQAVRAIRDACQKQQGKDFDLRAFHDHLLSFGSPDPAFLAPLMLAPDAGP